MFENFIMNGKDQNGRECTGNEETSRLQGGVRIPYKKLEERQGWVLTNQCLGKEQMLSEKLRNPSVLTDSDKLMKQRDIGAKII
jgi:hypothetical protein